MIRSEEICKIKNVDTGVEVDADILNFKLEEGIVAAVAGNKISMTYNKSTGDYVGRALGMEFVSKGPKYYEVKQGRQR